MPAQQSDFTKKPTGGTGIEGTPVDPASDGGSLIAASELSPSTAGAPSILLYDGSPSAAWLYSPYQRKNLTATTNPTATDDSTAASPGPYAVGSLWLNVTTDEAFICLDASAGAAIWKQISNSAILQASERENPNRHALGKITDYGVEAGVGAGDIQYSRVWLTAGLYLATMEVYISAGGSAARSVIMGIYDNVVGGSPDPENAAGIPGNKLVETALTPTGGIDGEYLVVPLLVPLTVPVTGYYWLAFLCDSTSLKFLVTPTAYRENSQPIRRESTGGATLPASAGILTNPLSAIVYVAAIDSPPP